MFSSLLRPRPAKRRVSHRDLSASPSSGQPAPRYRHAAADFTEADDDDEEGNVHQHATFNFDVADEDGDEDDVEEVGPRAGQRTPLPVLPLFSASHLGTSIALPIPQLLLYVLTVDARHTSSLQHHPFDTYHSLCPHRDDFNMGSAAVSSDLAVPRQAHAAANPNTALLPRNLVCLDGKLPAIHQRGSALRRQCWNKQYARQGLRTAGLEASEGVLHSRAHRCPVL